MNSEFTGFQEKLDFRQVKAMLLVDPVGAVKNLYELMVELKADAVYLHGRSVYHLYITLRRGHQLNSDADYTNYMVDLRTWKCTCITPADRQHHIFLTAAREMTTYMRNNEEPE